MSELDLFRELNKPTADRKLELLRDLIKRIHSDLFADELYHNELQITTHKKNMSFVLESIEKYKKQMLTKDDMQRINILNKMYARTIKYGED